MSPRSETIASIVAYSLCSGTLLLINKLILHSLPYPSLVTSFQLVSTISFIWGSRLFGCLEVDPLKWKFIVPYLAYTVAFSVGVFCNMKSLQNSNVETVIVFRALAPCIVSLLDTFFLGRAYPTLRSWGALGLIAAGAFGYAATDTKFQQQGIEAYGWPMAYLLVISFEMAYGKKIIKSVDLKTKSGPVLYTNLLGFPPMLLFAKMGNEMDHFWTDMWKREDGLMFPPGSVPLLILGSIVGTSIGYSAWWCRDKVSATSFTLIGVMNKCMTVLLNLLIWDQHATPMGIASLSLCLFGGMMYKQAPLRKDLVSSQSLREELLSKTNDDVWSDEVSAQEKMNGSVVGLGDEESMEHVVNETAPGSSGFKRRNN